MNRPPLSLTLAILLLVPAMGLAAPGALIIEAETLQPDQGASWKTIRYGENYFWDAIGNGYFSGEKLLSAPEHGLETSARLSAVVPQDGRYKLWVHYEAPADYNTCFGISVRQAGLEALNTVMGRADQVRLWPLGLGLRKQINPAYGGGDNVTWQGAELDLKAGPAEFILTAVPNPEPAAKRNLDVIYLTTELSDTPANKTDPFLNDFCLPGRFWVRIHNTSAAPIRFGVDAHWNRRDWRPPGSHVERTGLAGLREPIAPGGHSEWIDLGALMDTIHGTALKFSPQPRKEFAGARIELARAPDAQAVWQHAWTDQELPLTVWVPVDLDTKEIVTAGQMIERIEQAVQARPDGPVPGKIKFYSRLGPTDDDDVSLPRWMKLYYRFGYAGPQFHFGKAEPGWDRRFGGDTQRKYIGFTWQDPHTDPAKLRAEYGSPEHAASAARLEAFSIGDEIGLRHFGNATDESFREYLAANGVTLDQLGVSDWKEVKLVGSGRAFSHPVMYVETQKFVDVDAVARMRALTTAIREGLGRDIPIGANYAPHPIFLPEEGQWIDAFREGALTMPWSEDYAWQVPVISSQIIGWTLDIMRCAARDRGLPMIYYCMPHSPGNTAANFRLSNYLALGRGVRYIDHFVHGPQIYSTENYVDFHDTQRYQDTWDIIREAGRVDDLLDAGRPPKAETALMLCRYTDLWERSRGPDSYNIGGDNPNSHVYGIERQCVWLALKHAQVPVDLLTDPDVSQGRLAGYKTLYLAGSHISRKAATAIEAWVRDGGCLMSSAAGGLFDEYNRPLKVLTSVYGIASHELRQTDRCVRPKMELPRIKAMNSVQGSAEGTAFTMEALAIVDRVQLAGRPDVLGTFSDGSPAVIRNTHGRGTAYLVCTLPGLAYAKPAIPVLPFDRNEFVHFLPVAYPDQVRALLSMPLHRAKVVKRVECSHPLVEGDLLESAQGQVISLANFSGKPIKPLTIRIRPATTFVKVWSVRHGDLQARRSPEGLEVTMPLEVTDFLIVAP